MTHVTPVVPPVPKKLQKTYRLSADGSHWEHKCCNCGRWFPADPDHFQRNRHISTGLGSLCLPCNASRQRAWQIWNPDKAYDQCVRHRARHGNHITDQQWQDLLARYGYSCVCCGVADAAEPLERARIDHSQPAVVKNTQPLCRRCNARQGTHTVDYRPLYLQRMMRRAA